MKQHILLVVLLILVIKCVFSQSDNNQNLNPTTAMSNYTKYGIDINFEGSVDIIKNDPLENDGYFYQAVEIIRFNENTKIIEPNTQHLLSEEGTQEIIEPLELDTDEASLDDALEKEKEEQPTCVETESPISNAQSSLSSSFSYYYYLSSLYILPKMSTRKLKKELELYTDKHSPYQVTKEIQKIAIGDKKVLKWRIQSGKTRLDHYIVSGKKYNYLFVSSPYSSNGGIENVIQEMTLLKN